MDMTPDHRGCLLNLRFPWKALPATRTWMGDAVFESWYMESGVRAWGKGDTEEETPQYKHGGHQWYLLEASELPPAGLFTCLGGAEHLHLQSPRMLPGWLRAAPGAITPAVFRLRWHRQGAGRFPRAESRKTLAWGLPDGESLGPSAGLSSCPLLPHLPVQQGELLTSPTYRHRFQEKPALPRFPRCSLCEQP